MESVSKRGRFWGLIFLERGVSSRNSHTIDGCKDHSTTVHYIDYYDSKYSHDPRFNCNEQILISQDNALLRDMCGCNSECEESMEKTGETTSLHCQLRL
jgi:hypothetical protein